MNTLAFILCLVFVVLEAVAAFQTTARVNLIALGLAFFGVAFIVQLAAGGSTVHF